MINNIVFPPSVEVRPTFHVVRMKDEVNGNPTRVIVRFTLVKNYLLDSYGNPTVPQYHDPVYIDVMTHRMIEPSTFDFVMAFNPNQISGEINDLQRKAENEKAELEAKIATLDADVKQLSKGFDPRVTKLVEELDTLRKDYDAVVVESQRRFNDCQRFSKLLTEATNTVSDNAKTIKKLQSDAINVAIQRDNEVTTLATEKAKAMLPNIQRERDFFKERVDTLNEELHSARKFVEEAEGVMDDKDINWGRTVRKLEKKLRRLVAASATGSDRSRSSAVMAVVTLRRSTASRSRLLTLRRLPRNRSKRSGSWKRPSPRRSFLRSLKSRWVVTRRSTSP